MVYWMTERTWHTLMYLCERYCALDEEERVTSKKKSSITRILIKCSQKLSVSHLQLMSRNLGNRCLSIARTVSMKVLKILKRWIFLSYKCYIDCWISLNHRRWLYSHALVHPGKAISCDDRHLICHTMKDGHVFIRYFSGSNSRT
jgi:hypothetical protein